MDEDLSDDLFLKLVFEKIQKNMIERIKFRGLDVNYRKNVMELPILSMRGCHYEIGIHEDCHEIALHLQGSRDSNLSRLEGFRPHQRALEQKLGYSIILGPHEGQQRKRVWIKMPLKPLTQELVDQYSELTTNLIVLTLPILQSIVLSEK